MGNPVHRPRRPAKLARDNRVILRAYRWTSLRAELRADRWTALRTDEIAGHRGVADGVGVVTDGREAA